MDIAAWQKLTTQHEARSVATWQTRRALLSPSQRQSVWAWQHPSPEQLWQDTPRGPLTGVPYVAKDLFHVSGVPTLAGSVIHPQPARRTSALIAKLASLGAGLVAKTHLHEFAYGLTGTNPHYGDVEHPRHVGRTAGGSSSGSAAAVAAGCVPFGLGTDTAGSLRVPAAYCGLFSFRGQPGHRWVTDAFPLAPSFDTAGWLTTTAGDCAKLWELLHGTDQAVSSSTTRGAYLPSASLGIAPSSPENMTALDTAGNLLATESLNADHPLTAACRDVDVTYSILQSTEAFAVHQSALDRDRSNYGPAVWQRIDRGRHWTSTQVDGARLHALKIRAAYDRFFDAFDFLVTPVSLEPAPSGGTDADTTRETLLKLNTHVSIAGRPALSVPVTLPDGLTLGLQVVFRSVSCPVIPAIFARCESCFPPVYDSR